MNYKKLRRQLNSVYKKVPELTCVNDCSECCGPISFSFAEKVNVMRFARENNIKLIKKNNLECNAIDKNKKCLIYPVRPLICRLFGVVDKKPNWIQKMFETDGVEFFKCPKGQKPERFLTNQEADNLFNEVEMLSIELRAKSGELSVKRI